MQRFNFEGKNMTVLTTKKVDPWFVAKEVCEVLGLKSVGSALRRLDPDEKNTVPIMQSIPGNPNRVIISEPGLYKLISRSTKPEAKRFDRWVRHEVLPSIRKTGRYSVQAKQIPRAPKTYKEAVQHLLLKFEENKKLIAINSDWWRESARRCIPTEANPKAGLRVATLLRPV